MPHWGAPCTSSLSSLKPHGEDQRDSHRAFDHRQLIELSDQLAHTQGDKAAAERRMTATLAAKDGELNRLAQALADAQEKAEGASGRLAEVKAHRDQMETQAQQRADILAEMGDLEGQLAQTQVYNDYMAEELHSVMSTLKREKWELLGEMSLLERQLLAAKQRGGAEPGVSAEEEVAELKKAGAAARVDWAKVHACVCVCVRAGARACACVRACVCACAVCARVDRVNARPRVHACGVRRSPRQPKGR